MRATPGLRELRRDSPPAWDYGATVRLRGTTARQSAFVELRRDKGREGVRTLCGSVQGKGTFNYGETRRYRRSPNLTPLVSPQTNGETAFETFTTSCHALPAVLA